MAYRDPYNEPYGRQQPDPSNDDDFNPYNTHQVHPSYDQSGYEQSNYNLHYGNDAYSKPRNPPVRQATMRSFLSSDDTRTNPEYSKEVPPLPTRKETGNATIFSQGEFAIGGSTGPSDFRNYRSSFKENLWTKGGRGKCVGRFCCCSIMTLVYLVVSIFLALLLWVRPPAITIEDAGATQGQQLVQPTNEGININLGVNLSVSNPNYFSLNFREIKAELFYPINNTPIGGGTSKNIAFESGKTKNFTFPFAITYKSALDPEGKILLDLLAKCGATKSEITVNVKLTLGINVLMLPLSPVISNSFKFICPLDSKDLTGLGFGGGT